MNDFTASNGVHVRPAPGADGALSLHDGDVSSFAETIDRVDVVALREFFQVEADERLGRWRWPADPDFVVYEPREGQPARVLRESTAQALDYSRSEPSSSTPSAFRSAAQDYFDAHPEPKPWHDAKPGEVWLLTSNGGLYIDEPAIFDGRQFVFCSRVERNTIDTATAGGIRGARRIWPEVSS